MKRIQTLCSAMLLAVILHPTPAAAVRSVILQFPASDLKVHALFYSVACVQGTPCDEQTYYSDLNGQVSVPLLYGGPDVYSWWDKIHFDFPAYMNNAAWIDKTLAPSVEIYPASNVNDRWTTYAVPVDTIDVHNMLVFRGVHDWFQANYGFTRGTMQIQYSDKIEYETGSDVIDWPWDPAYWIYYNPAGWDRFTAAHEYTHASDAVISNHPPYCTTSTGGILGFVGATNCVPHDLCTKGSSYEGSWAEGIADATGWLYANSGGYSFSVNPCSDEVSTSTTGFYEGNCAALIFHVAQPDPHQWFNTYRYARLVNAQGQSRSVQTAEEFYSAWRDVDPSPDWRIGVHHPGTFDASAIYQWAILGTRSITGVADDSLITEGGKIHWIQKVDPNPANGNFSVRVRVPTSGDVAISLYSVLGRRIQRWEFPNLPLAETDLKLSVDGLASGVYVLKYEDASRHRATDTAKVTIVR